MKHEDGPIGGEDCEIDRRLGNAIESKTIPAVSPWVHSSYLGNSKGGKTGVVQQQGSWQ